MDLLLNYVIPFLVILTALVFVHELGHYWVARRNGVQVEVFSIGMGPELYGWTNRSGERWRISALPIGGYVKMRGEMIPGDTPNPELEALPPAEREKSFDRKRLGQRAAIVAAGPAANFLFAILLLAGLFAIAGRPFTPPTVDQLTPGSAAEAAGLRPGDRVVSVDGAAITRFEDLQRIVVEAPGRTLALVVLRDGAQVALAATPQAVTVTDRLGNERVLGRLGVRSTQMQTVRADPFTALWQATAETWSMTVATLAAVGEMIMGARSAEDLGGPLRIAQMSGDVAQNGIVPAITFMALLSINLGLLNLFPIPVLDGGHLLFYAAEAVRGRPLGARMQEIASMTGLALVLGLMVLVTWNDLIHLKVVDSVLRLIG